MVEVGLVDGRAREAVLDVDVDVVLAQRQLRLLAVGVDGDEGAAGVRWLAGTSGDRGRPSARGSSRAGATAAAPPWAVAAGSQQLLAGQQQRASGR